jgi:serine protease Do
MAIVAVERVRVPTLCVMSAALLLLAFMLPFAAVAREAPRSFADLAENLLPAVVNISTTQMMRADRRGPERPQFPPGSPFEEFFRDFFERRGQQGVPQRKATSLGSGFVIDATGYIVTNNHVIAEADEITVRFQDDTIKEAKIIGRDPKTDLAVLKVETDKPLTALDWGESDDSRVGEWVMAIGNPFGLGGTVTVGIISARARDINAGPYDDFLQTDASINRGNSGGPMFNMDGKVIGINTAIFSPSGGSIGIGFAIPSSLAKPVVAQLREYGRTRRGWLGVRIQAVTDEIAEGLGLSDAKGALVASVSEGGPAEKAGVEPGDVVLKFDGKDVERMRRLPRIVAETPIGKKAKVEVWRRGKTKMLSVKVGELEEMEKEVASALTDQGKGDKQGTVSELGLSLSGITSDLRGRFDLAEEVKGVVITEADPAGVSAEKGLRVGDVIIEINQEEVTTVAQVLAKVQEAKDANRRTVLLLVDRQGDLRFVAVGLAAG